MCAHRLDVLGYIVSVHGCTSDCLQACVYAHIRCVCILCICRLFGGLGDM